MIYIKRDGLFDEDGREILDRDLVSMLGMHVKTVEPMALGDLLSYLTVGRYEEDLYSTIFNVNLAQLSSDLLIVETIDEEGEERSAQQFESINIRKNTEVILQDNNAAKNFNMIEVFGRRKPDSFAIDMVPLSLLVHTGVIIEANSEMNLSWPKTKRSTKITVENKLTLFELFDNLLTDLTRFCTEEEKLENSKKVPVPSKE